MLPRCPREKPAVSLLHAASAASNGANAFSDPSPRFLQPSLNLPRIGFAPLQNDVKHAKLGAQATAQPVRLVFAQVRFAFDSLRARLGTDSLSLSLFAARFKHLPLSDVTCTYGDHEPTESDPRELGGGEFDRISPWASADHSGDPSSASAWSVMDVDSVPFPQ